MIKRLLIILATLCSLSASADLVHYTSFDDADSYRGTTNPPPALTTADGEWYVSGDAGSNVVGTAWSDTSTALPMVSSHTGVIGEACYGAGRNKRYVKWSNNNVLPAAASNFTVAFWFKPSENNSEGHNIWTRGERSGSGRDGMAIMWNKSADVGILMDIYNDNLATDLAVTHNEDLSVGTWYHMVMVVDPLAVVGAEPQGRIIGYIDASGSGVDGTNGNWIVAGGTNTFNSTTSFKLSDQSFHVGNRTPNVDANQSGKGAWDDYAMWDTALTVGKARSLYNFATNAVNYTAKQCDELWQAYDAAGSTNIGATSWEYATGLSGDEGDVSTVGGLLQVVLADDGTGMKVAGGGATGMIIVIPTEENAIGEPDVLGR